jgi:hypothetical protein
MPDDCDLRRLAREAVLEGRLPERVPDRMWGGPGDGRPCAICGAVLTRGDIGLEVEFGSAEAELAPSSYNVHVRCFAAWEAEWRRSTPTDLGHPAGGLRSGARDGTIPDRDRDHIPTEGTQLPHSRQPG